ncbi:AAA family ATPase [Advenella sp. EE-W14]|uniref:AAA family ATPase n=1 Tax=Advenella sp. EE-W14 TaxID=2722705 RepID=UPI00145D5B3B|nr:AAA family ATPase [Advenella sp. EE-W14]
MTQEEKSKSELGYQDNKDIPIKSIKRIHINEFRSFKERTIELGSQITVMVGRNGTMKTSLMGLIAHPFSSESKDAFGRELKTTLSNVFRFSPQYDNKNYSYNIVCDVDGKDDLLSEKVNIYFVAQKTNRHRVVVSGGNDGDGNFNYNTSFLNLKRLLPIVDTNAKSISDDAFHLDEDERILQKNFYESVFPSNVYDTFSAVLEKNQKTTFAPAGNNATYDFNGISSGEDNLGAVFNRMIGFQRAFDKNQKTGGGIFCIDEFDSSLHPTAQIRLFKYLYSWASKYKVQVVISTHSLHLILYIYREHKINVDTNRIVFNFISTAHTGNDNNYEIIKNPSYELAYKELTLEEPEDLIKSHKINIICEDDYAKHLIQRIVTKRNITNMLDFTTNLDEDSKNNGTAYTSMIKLCKNYSYLLKNSIVVFDADINEKILSTIKGNNNYLVLPDEKELAIERRIIYFILNLSGDNDFFKIIKKTREKFRSEFTDAGILSLTPADILDERKTPIKNCKKWANSDPISFKKYITQYVKTIPEQAEDFREKLISKMNDILNAHGLPEVKWL